MLRYPNQFKQGNKIINLNLYIYAEKCQDTRYLTYLLQAYQIGIDKQHITKHAYSNILKILQPKK